MNTERSTMHEPISAEIPDRSREQARRLSTADRLLASFDRVYVINLPKRADRRTEMSDELARIGTGFDDARVILWPAIRPTETGGFPDIGVHGCFLSHLSVLRDARAAGHDRILILEDDCDFAAGIEALLPPVLDRLDAFGFGIFYGGYRCSEDPGRLDSSATPLVRLDPAKSVLLAHCIGFGRAAIEGLVPYLETMRARAPGCAEGGPMHVDGAYTWFRGSRPDLTTWLARPQLAYQRPSRSDIAAPGLLERLPEPLRKIARKVRRKMKRRFP